MILAHPLEFRLPNFDKTKTTMTRPPRPQSTKPTLGNASSSNPFSSVLNDEGFTDEGQQPAILSDSSEDEDDHSSVSSSDTSSHKNNDQEEQRQRPPRPSMAAARASLLPSHSRNRRRSSARFLSLHRGRDSIQSTRTSHGAAATEPPANLTELYQKAIRMNAENKINAGNSWNLKLIENIDLFLGDNDDEEDEGRPTSVADENGDHLPNRKRVNFTKASCTLDASVKIYGYRVDDVHLTSYKVLANLNRSSGDTKTNNPNSSDNVEADDGAAEKSASRTKSSHNGNTLEAHIGTYETKHHSVAACCNLSSLRS